MKATLYRLFSATGCDQLALRLKRKPLRILAYHGVCEDRFAEERWVPPCFVSHGSLDQQFAYLAEHAVVLRLSDAVATLKERNLPGNAVSITFDDGYANNLHLAMPLLARYGFPATIFVSTSYVESGAFLPFDRLRLIHTSNSRSCDLRKDPLSAVREYEHGPLDRVLESLEEPWKVVQAGLSADQCEALRPLRVGDIGSFDPALIEIGSHTHTHCILRNEARERRDREIALSIERIKCWTGRPVRLFSFPRGQRGDYNEQDKQTLSRHGIEAAVTARSGTNGASCDLLELRRYSIGLFHHQSAFVAEVTGLRSLARSLVGRNEETGRTSFPA